MDTEYHAFQQGSSSSSSGAAQQGQQCQKKKPLEYLNTAFHECVKQDGKMSIISCLQRNLEEIRNKLSSEHFDTADVAKRGASKRGRGRGTSSMKQTTLSLSLSSTIVIDISDEEADANEVVEISEEESAHQVGHKKASPKLEAEVPLQRGGEKQILLPSKIR